MEGELKSEVGGKLYFLIVFLLLCFGWALAGCMIVFGFEEDMV